MISRSCARWPLTKAAHRVPCCAAGVISMDGCAWGNVLRALRHDHSLVRHMHEKRTAREDVMAFFDELAEQPHSIFRVVVLDNARNKMES